MIGINSSTLFYTKEQVMEFVLTLYLRNKSDPYCFRGMRMPFYFDIRQFYESGIISVAYYRTHVGKIDMFSERITYINEIPLGANSIDPLLTRPKL